MQQMYFWGCDVRSRKGNRLLEFGMTRIARQTTVGEGTSRYRQPWEGGMIELHGFCAGWYPPEGGEGVLFIRSRQSLYRTLPGDPLTPGHYEQERFDGARRDEMLLLCRPLVRWIAAYESWMAAEAGGERDRQRCWEAFTRLKGVRPWLPPVEARAWLAQFLLSPEATPRARRWRQEGKNGGLPGLGNR